MALVCFFVDNSPVMEVINSITVVPLDGYQKSDPAVEVLVRVLSEP